MKNAIDWLRHEMMTVFGWADDETLDTFLATSTIMQALVWVIAVSLEIDILEWLITAAAIGATNRSVEHGAIVNIIGMVGIICCVVADYMANLFKDACRDAMGR